MLLDTLLTIHILGVIFWIGFGVYELLLYREARNAQGTVIEIALIRISGRYAGIVAIATLIVAITGVFMTSLLGLGYFHVLWLGVLQAIMLAVLLDLAWITPTIMRAYKAVAALGDTPGPELEHARAMRAKLHPHFLLMRIGALVAVVVAVFRPL